jgi:hypothetical protein
LPHLLGDEDPSPHTCMAAGLLAALTTCTRNCFMCSLPVSCPFSLNLQ